MTGAEYELLEPASVPRYLAAREELAALVDLESLEVREIGDGNLNLVFLCRDGAGRGLVLKQALPYVRVRPSWRFTPRRAVAEALAYREHGRIAPEHVPRLLGFDEERYVLAVEDLSDHRVWRGALNDGERHDRAAREMGRYVGRIAFSTSPFSARDDWLEARALAAGAPELRGAMVKLVLTDPFTASERNRFQDELRSDVERLRAPAVVAAAGELRYAFMTRREALIHGDLHTGSVLVRGDGSTRAFDSEFCCYGPVAFDLGLLWSSFVIALARATVLGRAEHADWIAGLPGELWQGFETELCARWPERIDPGMFSDAFLEHRLRAIVRDAAGFAAADAARWVIGTAHVSDIETLEPDARIEAVRRVLASVRRLLLERGAIESAGDFIAIVREEIGQATG